MKNNTSSASSRTRLPQKGYVSVRSAAASVRFVAKYILRTPLKSMLSVVTAAVFVVALGWMTHMIKRSEQEVDHLYLIARVEAEIWPWDPVSVKPEDLKIRQSAVDAVMDSGYICGATLQLFEPCMISPESGGEEYWVIITLANCPNELAGELKNTVITYAEGWDEQFFNRDWPVGSTIPVVVSAGLSIAPGDSAMLSDYAGNQISVMVAGVGNIGGSILMPMSASVALSEALIMNASSPIGGVPVYSKAEFIIDPLRNRELSGFADSLTIPINKGISGRLYKLMVWDDELRAVMEPMENTLSLLAVLYPVTMAVSVLITAGLALLITLQNAKTAAILRVLGTKRARVMAMQCCEQFVMCLIGVLIGIAATSVAFGGRSVMGAQATMRSALYLSGTLVGSGLAAYTSSRQMPLELLQVKE